MKTKFFSRAVIINKSGEFLVLRSIKRARYEFPGGKVEGIESYKDCAVREVKEEVGLKISSLRLLTTRKIDIDEVEWYGHLWIPQEVEGESSILEPDKFDDLRWVTLAELVRLPQIPHLTYTVAEEASLL